RTRLPARRERQHRQRAGHGGTGGAVGSAGHCTLGTRPHRRGARLARRTAPTTARDIAHLHAAITRRPASFAISSDEAGMILLIEDNRGISEMVGEFLERRGYAVDYAADGSTGLHLAVENSYDVVVLDLMLPGMDGLDLCRRLRGEAKKSTPVLMLTA